jgi:hypothetical protein
MRSVEQWLLFEGDVRLFDYGKIADSVMVV